MEVTSLSDKEMKETNGGIIGLILLYILQATVVGTLCWGIVGNYEKGYNQAQAEE